ncbi:hypothetical protein ACQUWL_20960 [Serratia marcescens]|uniref:hypothetical protein n=1 Tax=Serratia marcescens TaxID=615 RepID=UPI003D184D00
MSEKIPGWKFLLIWTVFFLFGLSSLIRPSGGGDMGVACIRAGRQFIGIEKEQKYFDIAADRIARAEGREVAA